MILQYYKFDKKSYNGFINYLNNEADLEYKKFNTSIVNTEKNVIGNRIPFLRKIAKNISKGDYKNFIKLNTHQTHEEIIIHGLIIGYLKLDMDNTIKMLDDFIIHIDNWAVNDITSSNLSVFKKEQDKGIEYIKTLINSDNPWFIRFSLTLMLSHYIDDANIDMVIDLAVRVENPHYYVMMAKAWLLSMIFVKYNEKIMIILENNILDKESHNKTISKIRESRQVSSKLKEEVNKLKRR